ncbi:MAG: beta-ketoacyl synthase N-terminal-like domain-containing protein [Campylobacterota bacterium]|nr:beta-ketoacyl synthase N-terminal-like domain-containing protein [Campylobacterota bacterium]
MDKIYIQNYAINSSQGDLKSTISAIKNEQIEVSNIQSKRLNEEITIPYYLLENRVEENQSSIYKALRDVVEKVVTNLSTKQRASTAIFIGTSLADLNITDAIEDSCYAHKRKEYSTCKRSIDTYAKELAYEFGLNEFTMSINTACTSSANALLEASNFIKSKIFENVVVVGVEIYSKTMSSGFSSMNLLSPTSLKSFDKNREGLILGEGVAAILVSNKKSSWLLCGGFTNCNSTTITSVSEDGSEFLDVMQNSLKKLNLKKGNITAVKAHATGTATNDIAEINAIRELFTQDVLFTALKPYIGHTLGACGALELAIFIGAIDDGFIPKSLNCNEPIYENYSPLKEHIACKSGTFMLNYFGFGGSNTSLIIQKEHL